MDKLKQCYCDASDEIVFEDDCKKCCFYTELSEYRGGCG